jgi:hypothetical protein
MVKDSAGVTDRQGENVRVLFKRLKAGFQADSRDFETKRAKAAILAA